MRHDPVRATCTCGRTWKSDRQAHCALCHSHFSTDANFDRHLPKLPERGYCLDPGDCGLIQDERGVWKQPPKGAWIVRDFSAFQGRGSTPVAERGEAA